MFDFLTLYASWGVLFVRAVYGFVFITHGSQKIFGGGLAGTSQFFAQVGIKPAKPFAWIVGAVEFVSGIAMVLGAYTRFAALATAVIMVVAIAKVKRKQGFANGYEFDLLLFAVAVMFVLVGAGEQSLDYMFR